MMKLPSTLLTIALAGVLIAPAALAAEASRLLEPEQFQMRADQGTVTLIDVRTPAEYTAGHIAGARNIPQSRLKERLTQIEKYKDTPVIVVCKQGQTAGAAVTELTQAGFSRVYKLKGGMAQWQADGLPVVRR